MASELPDEPAVDASKAEWAAYLADLGRQTRAFKVFQCTPDGKGPFNGVRWKDAAIWDRKSVEALWADHPDCNIGMAIQPGFVALDADVYKPEHAERLAMFEAKHGKLPETMEFSSARGGRHLIYSTDRDLGNGLGSLPDFGDVRGHGGYLVGPGSTFEGKRYTIVDPGVPEALPKAVDACLVERREAAKSERTLPPFVMLDDTANVARYTEWLRHSARPSIDGQGGNNNLAAAAAMGSSYGLSADRTVELLLEHFNPRCAPEWPAEDVEKYGGSGYRSASSDFGNMAAKNDHLMFEPRPGEDGWGPAPVTAAAIAGKTPPARQWALGDDREGWMPLGDLTTLYGPDGAGKTTLVGQMALAFARGEKLFGGIPARKMPVLFIACEDDEGEIHRRFEKQGIERSDAVRFASLIGMDTAMHPAFRRGEALTAGQDTPFYRYLDYHLTQMGKGDKLVILDNLGQIYHGDYMDIAQVRAFLNVYCRRLLKTHTATGLVLAHPSDSQKTNGDGSYGSVAWSGGVRSRLYFDWVRDKKGKTLGDTRILARRKASYSRKHGEGEGLLLDWDNYRFVPQQAQTQQVTEGFKPVSAARQDVKDAAILEIVKAEVERVLKGNPTKAYSFNQLAADVAHDLGQRGHVIGSDAIRKNYLKQIRDGGHPYYDRLGGRGEWRARQTLH